jgi:hypothetical protein
MCLAYVEVPSKHFFHPKYSTKTQPATPAPDQVSGVNCGGGLSEVRVVALVDACPEPARATLGLDEPRLRGGDGVEGELGARLLEVRLHNWLPCSPTTPTDHARLPTHHSPLTIKQPVTPAKAGAQTAIGVRRGAAGVPVWPNAIRPDH